MSRTTSFLKSLGIVLIIAPAICSCTTKEGRIMSTIRNYMTQNNFESYEPIETTVDSIGICQYGDTLIFDKAVSLSKAYTEFRNLKDEDERMKKVSTIYGTVDSLETELRELAKNSNADYSKSIVSHKFIRKSKEGTPDTCNYFFIVSKDNEILRAVDEDEMSLNYFKNVVKTAMKEKKQVLLQKRHG